MPSSAFPLLSVPPPFPYTTLFRSSFLRRFADRGGWYKAPAQRIKELLSVRGRHRQQQSARSLRIVEQVSDILRDTVGEFDALRNELDRKSTRLNSSHQIISYAVFCFPSTLRPSPLSLHDALPI